MKKPMIPPPRRKRPRKPHPLPPPPPSPPPAPPPPHPEPDILTSLIAAHNEQRPGLPPFIRNESLMKIAQQWADNMAAWRVVEHGDTFSRFLPYFPVFNKEGENIAAGQPDVESVILAWMKSPEHHQNIVDGAFTQIGVGFARDSTGYTYWVVDFLG